MDLGISAMAEGQLLLALEPEWPRGMTADLGLALAGEGHQPGGRNTLSPPAGRSGLGLEEAPALL